MPQNVILDLSWTTKDGSSKKTYAGWSGEASKPLSPNAVFTHGQNSKMDVLEMDPQLGQAIGLVEGQKVGTLQWEKKQHALMIVIRSMWNSVAISRIVHQ